MTQRPRVLVTDAHTTGALAVVRSLGAQGYRLTVAGEEGRFNLAFHSRHVHETRTWPRAETQPAAHLARLEEELAHSAYDVLLPITDTTITLVRHRREHLDALVRVALPPNDVLDQVLDKSLTLQVASRQGVATPATHIFSSLADVRAAATSLTYPCVVKSRFSRRWDGTGPMRRGSICYAHSAEALGEIFSATDCAADAFLVQALVKGTGTGVFVLADRGAPLAIFAHRRVREANPTGGRASLAESVAPDSRLVAPALAIIEALRWSGVAMVEFKDPGPPADPIVMEVNGRFWGSLPLAVAAGVDFPLLALQWLSGDQIVPSTSYRVGLRCRHLKGDLSYLAAALKGRPTHWHEAYPTRLGALAAVVPWPGRWRSYNFSMKDPMPAFREVGDWFHKEVSRIPRGVRTLAKRSAQ